jgi:phosphate transport system permease protein
LNLFIARYNNKGDQLFSVASFAAALCILLVVLGVWFVLLYESGLAIKTIGFLRFILSSAWNPGAEQFGALIPLTGTILTTMLALLLAIPVSFGIAIFIVEICPTPFKAGFGIAVELLATIPSIIFGMWGFYRLAPIMGEVIEPALQSLFIDVPLIGRLFTGTPLGIDILTASVILSIMIIPFIASIIRETIQLVPEILKESAYSIGATKWEVIRDIVIPYSKQGIYGGIIIAMGRALGETMAVTFVLGAKHKFATSFFDATSTITVTLVNEFTEANSEIYYSSLVYLALILFTVNFIALSVARLLVLKGRK